MSRIGTRIAGGALALALGLTGGALLALVPANVSVASAAGLFVGGPRVSIFGHYLPVAGDFNGDGKTDVIWYTAGPKPDALLVLDRQRVQRRTDHLDHRHVQAGRRRLQRRRQGRRVLVHAPPAQSVVWYGAASGFTGGPAFQIWGNYKRVVGDWNGDGKDDIIWDNPGTGTPQRVWYGSAVGFTGTTVAIGGRAGCR